MNQNLNQSSRIKIDVVYKYSGNILSCRLSIDVILMGKMPSNNMAKAKGSTWATYFGVHKSLSDTYSPDCIITTFYEVRKSK